MPVMRGRLVYVVGPSGSGKDTILRTIDERRERSMTVAVARRFITRPIVNGVESHTYLTEAEFFRRREQGFFAMDWRGHRYCYGIGTEIDTWMQQGVPVLVNGSRAYLAEAKRRYPDLVTIWLQVDEDILKTRLFSRGRERPADIESRLMRNDVLEGKKPDDVYLVDNSGDLIAAIRQILSIVARRGLP